jgi:HTH-type transcriptional regulator / antitoxin HigA
MITNDRQYRTTKSELSKMRAALEAFNMEQMTAAMGHKAFAQAHFQALESEAENLFDQIREYERLRAGSVDVWEAQSLDQLPILLIKARIASGLSQKQLAAKLGLKEQQIQRYESEKYASASLRRLIEIADSLGLRMSERARLEVKKAEPPTSHKSSPELNWVKFPLKEMYRREWFKGFTGTFRDAEVNAQELISNFLNVTGPEPVRAFHRKHVRSGSVLDEYSLLAWHSRILELAANEHIVAPFKKSRLTKEWINGLAKLSAKNNGPQLAKEFLKDVGLALVVEPRLPQTYLDGAALLYCGKTPVIGMTLRFDRIDNFWFVLFHELAHVMLHLDKDVEFFDDLEAAPDGVEKEADEFACESLIPMEVWEKSIARYSPKKETIKELAAELGISPAVVAGRIRKESENWTILNDLIGVGEVRKQFAAVKFGQ